jgi:hypothetical protein
VSNDEDGRAAYTSQCTNHCCNVTLKRVEAVLGGYYLVPSDCSVGMTLLKHEPSAHNPCANTMLGFVFMDMVGYD